MRKDVKIGLALGLVLLLVIVVYFAAKDGGPQPGRLAEDAGGLQTQPKPKVVKVALKSQGPGGEVVRPARPGVPSMVLPQPAMPVTIRPVALAPATQPAAEQPLPVVVRPERPKEVPAAAIVPVVPQAPVDKARTYVVQTGDYRGFWGIAEKVYGDGKHYQAIAQANPGVDPHKLRTGQKLVIPAISQADAAQSSGQSAKGEERTYTIEKGDGLWIIAQKVYGHGKHWPRIAGANPDVNINALPVGKKLTIPPLAEREDQGKAKVLASPGAAGRTYTVQAGDKGFWGIAEKVYGDGKYGPLIARANPGVDSDSLQAGQVLAIPALTAAEPSLPKAPRSRPAALERDDRPLFD